MAVEIVTAQIGDSPISFETGKLAKQANGAVLVRSGDTMVLVTAVGAQSPRPGADFFPLTVDVEERMYAAGKIPGGFIKRESRPSDRATLTARMIDRPIRPLWPKGYRNEMQVVATILSVDQVNAVRHPRAQRRVRGADDLRAAVRRPGRRRAHRPDGRRVHHQPDAPGDRGVRARPDRRGHRRGHLDGRGRRQRGRRGHDARGAPDRPRGDPHPLRRAARAPEGGRQAQVGRRAAGRGREGAGRDREGRRQGPRRGHPRAGQAAAPRQDRRRPRSPPPRPSWAPTRTPRTTRPSAGPSTRSRRASSASASRSTSSAPTVAPPTRSGRSRARSACCRASTARACSPAARPRC